MAPVKKTTTARTAATKKPAARRIEKSIAMLRDGKV